MGMDDGDGLRVQAADVQEGVHRVIEEIYLCVAYIRISVYHS